jgi:hypothetical protein
MVSTSTLKKLRPNVEAERGPALLYPNYIYTHTHTSDSVCIHASSKCSNLWHQKSWHLHAELSGGAEGPTSPQGGFAPDVAPASYRSSSSSNNLVSREMSAFP